MDFDRIFVDNVKKWRKSRGFSQKTLAEHCGAAHSYIRQIESGSGKPSFAFIGKLAGALGIEAWQLFYGGTEAREGNSPLTDRIAPVKADFLAKMGREFDIVIKKLKM